MLNVEAEPPIDEILVGVPHGHFVIDMSGDHGALGDSTRIYSILMKVDDSSGASGTIPVAVRGGGSLSEPRKYELRSVDPNLQACMVPVAVANEIVAGQWVKLDGSSWQFFAPTIEFRKTFFGGGHWVGNGLVLNYGIAVDPDGCDAEPSILLTDANDNLVITYNYSIAGSILNLSNWTRRATYERVGDPPIGPPPAGKVYVPHLRGLRREDAMASLVSVGLSPGPVTLEQTGNLPDDSVVGQNPQGGALVDRGTAVSLVISEKPDVQITMTDLRRVPIGAMNAREIAITIEPALPAGDGVEVELRTLTGTGSATFEDGTINKTISGSTTLRIVGVANSNVKDNIRVDAVYAFERAASDLFSVRTWPKLFEQHQVYRGQPSAGVLAFEYRVESESGVMADMNGNFIGEWVDYPDDACGGPDLYCFPSPPYRRDPERGEWVVDDPHTDEKRIGDEILKMPDLQFFFDTHKVPTVPKAEDDQLIGFSSVRTEHVFIATQEYRFRDPVLMQTITLDGPYFIRRNVYLENGLVWKYRIEKNNESTELLLP